jgi:hypothetical protein
MDLFPSTTSRKRFTAVYADGRKVSFGQPGATTYADGASEEKRASYLARHNPAVTREDWDNPYTAGALSRWILWEKPSIGEGLRAYRLRFGLL